MNDASAEKKLESMKRRLDGLGTVVVAFSGGVDSTFLAAVAHEVLGQRALSVTTNSPTYQRSELEESKSIAKDLGLRHMIVETNQLEQPEFVRNSEDRCFYCKEDLYARLRPIADAEGIQHILDGFNRDDESDHRPGRQSAIANGIISPLYDVGLTKAEIRGLSRQMGLSTWNKPAQACLSSRVAYGTAIDAGTLGAIDQVEDFLRSFGFRQVRVRHHGTLVRLEVTGDEIARLTRDEELRASVVELCRSLGWNYVTVDMTGYRTGSFNEVIPLTAHAGS